MIVTMTMLSSCTWSRGICHHWFSLTDPVMVYNIIHIRLGNEFKWLYMQKERDPERYLYCEIRTYTYINTYTTFIFFVSYVQFIQSFMEFVWTLSEYCVFSFSSFCLSVILSFRLSVVPSLRPFVFGKGWMVNKGLRSSKSTFCVNLLIWEFLNPLY